MTAQAPHTCARRPYTAGRPSLIPRSLCIGIPPLCAARPELGSVPTGVPASGSAGTRGSGWNSPSPVTGTMLREKRIEVLTEETFNNLLDSTAALLQVRRAGGGRRPPRQRHARLPGKVPSHGRRGRGYLEEAPGQYHRVTLRNPPCLWNTQTGRGVAQKEPTRRMNPRRPDTLRKQKLAGASPPEDSCTAHAGASA